ncbi:putative rossmann-like alpha/beta/alpha sandwich protein [Lupinus albus]|uniref:Putative rossmann-like alpha/beta/alpha sandwich protein n=1 Tax=Lupinus albus TaxID=3870 RepID=A0A6A4PMU8_LUPAL|nr:putative rossmann-like alpha/beta/alpha sandwich protein [Lupinus albus]
MANNNNRNGTQARKVMVVADPTRESAGALQYALSHAVLEQDELILLHVENPNSWRNTISTFLKMPSLGSSTTASLELGAATTTTTGEGEVDFIEEMKNACRVSQPKMRVRVLRVDMDGKDRASTILLHSNNEGVDVIVIGQKRSLSSALLGYKRSGGGSVKGAKMLDTAEYLIQNSQCICVGVQRKGQSGGYVLNTKTHRNFWLLA